MHGPDAFDTEIAAQDIDGERPRPIATPWGTLALYRVGARILCADAFCPHLLGPLFQGTLCGATVTCPWHQWRFDLESGARIDAAGAGDGCGPWVLTVCRVETDARGCLRILRPAKLPPASA